MTATATAKNPSPPADAAPAGVAETPCHHCGLPVPAAIIEPESEAQFCCGGCRVAYDTIHGCGLDEYYAVRDRLSQDRLPASGGGGRYAAYDAQVFLEKHARRLPEGLTSIDLYLEGVHCAACVWLVERLPQLAPGVLDARLSLASSSARIVWDPQQTPLSRIAATLDRLGYAPHPARSSSAGDASAARERNQLTQMAVAGALAGNNMLIALALYAGVFDGIEPRFASLFRWISMGLGWLSLLWPGRVFFRNACSALRARTANLDVPIALAIGVGALAGTANVLLNRGDVYFDSLSVLVFLLLVGRFIQARQQRWAGDAVNRMLSLTPTACRVLRGGEFTEEPIETLEPGDTVEVRPGELMPADGDVCSGASSIDRSLLTGESLPCAVAVGDAVVAGAQNLQATLRVRVTATGESTRVGRLARLVEQGLSDKPKLVQFTDRIAGWFIVVIIAAAGLNFAAWSALASVAAAIDSTVALLIVACPCALGLATPLTMALAIGRASRRGVLVKSAHVIETLGGVAAGRPGRMFLDKTGTLTLGRLRVVDWCGDPGLQPLAFAIEAESNHPIAKAIVAKYADTAPQAPAIDDRAEAHGYGVAAECDLGDVALGSPRWLAERCPSIPHHLLAAIEAAEKRGKTAVAVGVNREIRAVLSLEDELRSDATAANDALRHTGWATEVLSGDTAGPVRAVAQRLGLTPAATRASLSPEDKLRCVKGAKADGDNQQRAVVMVGDGVNDAAALAAADVGIAVHGGAEAALAAADVFVSKPGLRPIVQLTSLARRTVWVVRQNLAISLAYNTLAVSLAAAGVVTPLVAAILMPISSATVLAGAVYGLAGEGKN
ncbi:MAG: heavy metal translocating P-type ATPase [Planctomycetota bacterium]